MRKLWCSRFQDNLGRVSDMYVPILKLALVTGVVVVLAVATASMST
jgi:hypothetical protein